MSAMTFDTNKITSNNISSLDGLRALSILIVIAQHFSSAHQFGPHDYLWRFQLGDLGVRIFFVISGFLITTLLMEENTRHGKIDLYRFYARRFLRIFPAYYFFLAIIFIFTISSVIPNQLGDLLSPLFYFSNYFETSRVLAHTWSLSVEQQFYLIWPFIIVLIGFRYGLCIAIAFALLAPLYRLYLSLDVPNAPTIWAHFQTTGDAIAAGCIFAMLRERLWAFKTYRSLINQRMLALAVLAIGFLATSHKWPVFWNGAGSFMMTLLIVIMTDCCIRMNQSIAFKVLNSAPLVFIGTISYSLYIWQQLFAYGKLTQHAALSTICLFIVACLSYFLVERPALKLKRLFAKA